MSHPKVSPADVRPEALLQAAFAPLVRVALGIAVGVWTAVAVFLATAILVLKGGSPIGPHLELLGQYFPGYTVTWTGSVLGLGYGFVTGFVVGWAIAFIRNAFIATYLHIVKVKANLSSVSRFLGD